MQPTPFSMPLNREPFPPGLALSKVQEDPDPDTVHQSFPETKRFSLVWSRQLTDFIFEKITCPDAKLVWHIYLHLAIFMVNVGKYIIH